MSMSPFLILKAESPFWKKLLDKVWDETQMGTPPQLRVLDDHIFEVKFKLLLALKLLVFHRGATKRKIESVSNLKVRYIYIYRICIYIYLHTYKYYLHTYKYYLHTYTYYIYIFDIGVSESKLPVSAFWFKKAERVFFTAWEAVAGCCDTNDVSCVRRLRDMPHAHNPVQICTCRCELLAKHQPDIRYFFAKCSCIFWYQRKIMHIVTWPDK